MVFISCLSLARGESDPQSMLQLTARDPSWITSTDGEDLLCSPECASQLNGIEFYMNGGRELRWCRMRGQWLSCDASKHGAQIFVASTDGAPSNYLKFKPKGTDHWCRVGSNDPLERIRCSGKAYTFTSYNWFAFSNALGKPLGDLYRWNNEPDRTNYRLYSHGEGQYCKDRKGSVQCNRGSDRNQEWFALQTVEALAQAQTNVLANIGNYNCRGHNTHEGCGHTSSPSTLPAPTPTPAPAPTPAPTRRRQSSWRPYN